MAGEPKAPDEGTPHDALFKQTFGVPRHARGELRAVLPPSMVQRFDWRTLRALPGSFTAVRGKSRHADVLLSVRVRGGGEVLVYVLLEHQSTLERWMVVRLLGYLVRIWERWLDEHAGVECLPPIVPVVVSHAPGGWRAPVALADAFGVDGETLEALRPHLPLFRMVLDDLSRVTDDELRSRAMSAMGKLALGLLKNARTFDHFFDQMEHWADAMREVLDAPGGFGAQAAVLNYMHRVNSQVPPEQVAERLGRLLGEGAKEAYVSYADQFIQQGRQERGRSLLRKQLERRFGPLPPAAVARLDSATDDDIDRWAELVLTAPSMNEVLQG
jgi:hypothetical protein